MTRAALAVRLDVAGEVLDDELDRRLLVRVGSGERPGLRERLRRIGLERRGVGIEAIDRVGRADVDEPVGPDGDAARLVDDGVELRLRERLVGLLAEQPYAAAVLGPAAHLGDDEVTGVELRDAAREREARRHDADADARRRLEVLETREAVARSFGGVRVLAGVLGGRVLLAGGPARGHDGRCEEGREGETEREKDRAFHRVLPDVATCGPLWARTPRWRFAGIFGVAARRAGSPTIRSVPGKFPPADGYDDARCARS